MKYLFFFLTGLLMSSSLQAQQKPKRVKAWKIEMKGEKKALPGATSKEREKVKKYNEKSDTVEVDKWVTDDFVKIIYHRPVGFGQLFNLRDSTLTTFHIKEKEGMKFDYPPEASDADTLTKITHFKIFPDSTRKIQGFRCHKATYVLRHRTEEPLFISAWYTAKLPYLPVAQYKKNKIPGQVLQIKAVIRHTVETSTATKVHRVKVPLSTFRLPDDFTITDYSRNASSDGQNKTNRRAKKPLEKTRDSLLTVLNKNQPEQVFQRASVFKYGFAHVETEDTTFYINLSGKRIFDRIIKKYQPIDSIKSLRPGWVHYDRSDSITMFVIEKDGKYGLWNSETGPVLAPEYDAISVKFKRYLKLEKNGKMGYADTWGKTILPVQFTDANIMDDRYFDVKKGAHWGIYDNKTDKMVLPAVYDGFDYCGGCGASVEYAYASKNGKWGVISFKDSVLVPFEYAHPGHWGMRSDNWVTSFEKDSVKVVINMNTNQVYSGKEYQQMRVYNGALALKKDGEYALIGRNGQPVTDFDYDDVVDPYDHFHWGPFIKVYQNDQQGIVDNKGKVIIPIGKYDLVYIRNHHFVVKKNDKTGVLDFDGKTVIPLQYDEVLKMGQKGLKNAKDEDEIVYEVDLDKKEGFLNLTSGDKVKPQFKSVKVVYNRDSTRNYIQVESLKEESGLFTLHGKEVVPPRYKNLRFITNRLVRTENKDYKEGVYDLKNKKEIFPARFEAVGTLGKHYLFAKNYGTGAVLKIYDLKNGKPLHLPYDSISLSGQVGLLVVDQEDTSYLYSLEKRQIISKGYPVHKSYYGDVDGIDDFSQGLAQVEKDGKYGFINTEGTLVVPVKYDAVQVSKKGILKLSTKSKAEGVWDYQYADSTGHLLNNKVYSQKKGFGFIYPYRFQNGGFLAISHYSGRERRNKIGLMDERGNVVVPAKYDKVTPFLSKKGFIVQKGRKYGIYNAQGEEVMPAVLDNYYYLTGKYLTHQVNEQFPILCVLKDYFFYLTAEGKRLPFMAKGHLTLGASQWNEQ